jgi:hypothetical protein
MGNRRGANTVLVGKPRRRWKDNIKINLLEVRWECMDWIDLAQDRNSLGSCKCGNEHSDSIKCGEFPDQLRIC